MRILVVRLGAMGDIIHALPAVAALKSGCRDAWIAWAVEPRWIPLLDSNPNVDAVVSVDRKRWAGIREAWALLRELRIDCAVDFQGLIKSALVARASAARRIIGYSETRESIAAWFYTERHPVHAAHIVDRHLELVSAAGATPTAATFDLPNGVAEGSLPERFVLASPFAGWTSKEWPLERYAELAKLLPCPLVLNGHPAVESQLRNVAGVQVHISSIAGLIDATRRATAVVGCDSGPLHLAAALQKPGVAIFGPTDPARNGPYGTSIRVLRSPEAVTSYRRGTHIDPGMASITARQVAEALSLS